MVFDEEPVTDLLAVAVDGEGFTGESVVDDEGDEFFWEVVRPVVVGAVGGEYWETVGMVVGTDEVVAGGLAC